MDVNRIIACLLFAAVTSISCFSQEKGKIHPRPFVPYHGMRMEPDGVREFKVTKITGRLNSNNEKELFEIIFRFSVPVDPRTVSGNSVKLNGRICTGNVFFTYGRKGESIRISVFEPDAKNYDVEFTELKAFNGDRLNKVLYEYIEDGTECRVTD